MNGISPSVTHRRTAPPRRGDAPDYRDLYRSFCSGQFGTWVGFPAAFARALGPSAGYALCVLCNRGQVKGDGRGWIALDPLYAVNLFGLPSDRAEKVLRRLARGGYVEVRGGGKGRQVRVDAAAVLALAGGGPC
jgi:hypothetical protein